MEPYHLAIDEAEIVDLHDRLRRTRWPDPLPHGKDDSGGVPPGDAREWAADLLHLDWRGLQEEINRYPQWTTRIDGELIHLLHLRSPHADAVPLLLLHGWPGTVVDYLDLLTPLTDPGPGRGPAFHVVLPSHAGTELSGPTTSPGWGVPRTARAYATLMERLGYPEFVVHGGDHGAVLAPHSGRLVPERVRGGPPPRRNPGLHAHDPGGRGDRGGPLAP